MTTLTADEFQNIGTLLREAAPPGPRLINGMIKAERKFRPLLKDPNVKAITLSKDATEFVAEAPVYVRQVDFAGSDTAKIVDGLSLKLKKIDGTLHELKPKAIRVTFADSTSATVVRYQVNAVGISLIAKSTLSIRKLKATSVRVYGYGFEQLDLIASKVARVNDLALRLDTYVEQQNGEATKSAELKAQIEAEIGTREARVEELEQREESLSERIDGLDKDAEKAEAAKIAIERSVSDARSSLESVRNNEAQLTESVSSLNREISQKKSALDQLVNDRNLISDEYRDYVSEGKQQSRVYEWFLYFSMATIAACAWQLYAGASRILSSNPEGLEGLLTLSLQRLPFAAALALIVTVSWKLASVFVARIMSIHAQRLALARLLVIAKDTVYSSTAGLDVSDEYKFRERIRLKLAMLRSHLTSELGRDFEYRPAEDEIVVEASKAEVNEGLARAAASRDD